MARGYTDALGGRAIVSGIGGDRVLELRVTEGQHVKRGDIIAVLSNYPLAESNVRLAEAELKKAEARRQGLLSGVLVASPQEGATPEGGGKPKAKSGSDSNTSQPGIAEQQAVVRLSAEETKLKSLNMERSGLPNDQKELEIGVSKQSLERDRAKLRSLQEKLASYIAENESDIQIRRAQLENARVLREQGLVRSPLDGVVVQIWTHPGERISRGIAEIVDMRQLRIAADVDEVLLNRIKVGDRADVTFRGEKNSVEGKVAYVGAVVRRTSLDFFANSTTNVRTIQVEIELNDPSQMPHFLGREATVTFLGRASRSDTN
jgi:HlyD family secretion protein